MSTDKTKTLLIEDLRKKEPSPTVDALIDNAEKGFYHDWESKLDWPKTQLYHDLRLAGFNDLAELVKQGRYD